MTSSACAVGFRAPERLLDRLDRVQGAIAADPRFAAFCHGRSATLRRCLELGLDAIEAEYGIGTETPARKRPAQHSR